MVIKMAWYVIAKTNAKVRPYCKVFFPHCQLGRERNEIKTFVFSTIRSHSLQTTEWKEAVKLGTDLMEANKSLQLRLTTGAAPCHWPLLTPHPGILERRLRDSISFPTGRDVQWHLVQTFYTLFWAILQFDQGNSRPIKKSVWEPHSLFWIQQLQFFATILCVKVVLPLTYVNSISNSTPHFTET